MDIWRFFSGHTADVLNENSIDKYSRVEEILSSKQNKQTKKLKFASRGCGSVGEAVASNSRGPQFESSYGEKLY